MGRNAFFRLPNISVNQPPPCLQSHLWRQEQSRGDMGAGYSNLSKPMQERTLLRLLHHKIVVKTQEERRRLGGEW